MVSQDSLKSTDEMNGFNFYKILRKIKQLAKNQDGESPRSCRWIETDGFFFLSKVDEVEAK